MYRPFIAALGAIAVVAAGLPTAASAQENVLRIGLREDPDLLDPTLGSSYVARVVFTSFCDKLFDVDSDLKIVPQLATGFEYKDPTHLVIHLRQGVTFQDGEPFNAEAVKYKIIRDQTAKGSQRAAEVSAVASIDTPDPYTVQLNLKVPSSPLLALFTDRPGMMLSPKSVEAQGDKFGLHPVCAGPFTFKERIAQDRIVVDRFPGYWDAKNIHYDRVVFLPTPNSAVRLANLQAGAVELVEQIVPTDMAAVRKTPGLKLAVGNGLGYMGISFNTDNPPNNTGDISRNALVRQAFELSIDRKALIDVVYDGAFTPITQANTPSSPFYVPGVQPKPRDIEKAKALLKQAGVKLPVSFTVTIPNNPDLLQSGEVIQSMAREAGFDMKIRATEFASALTTAYSGNFDAFMVAFSGRADADGNMWPFLHTGGVGNYGKYSNAGVDKALDESRLVNDVGQRRALYAQVWDQRDKDVPLIYLWIYKNIVGLKQNITGFNQVPDGLIRLQGMQSGR
jgi:peptide/nickel transport system substrate-binding protein